MSLARSLLYSNAIAVGCTLLVGLLLSMRAWSLETSRSAQVLKALFE